MKLSPCSTERRAYLEHLKFVGIKNENIEGVLVILESSCATKNRKDRSEERYEEKISGCGYDIVSVGCNV